MAPGQTPSHLDPLLTLELVSSGNDDGHIIATTPRPPLSSSPSSTYPLRVIILNIIVIFYFAYNIISTPIHFVLNYFWSIVKLTVQIIGLLGLFLVVAWWWKGRPPLEEVRESIVGVLGRTTESLRSSGGPLPSGARRRSGEQVRQTRFADGPDLEAGKLDISALEECDIGVRGST